MDPNKLAHIQLGETEVPLFKRDISCMQILHGHSGKVLCCSFDFSGGTLATGSDDGEIRLWRVVSDEWRCVKTLELGPAVTACQFQASGAGGMLCTGSADNAVRVWKALKGDCVAVMNGHKDCVSCVSYDPLNNDVMCSGSQDATVRVWKASTQKQTRIFEGDKGHKSPVLSVSYNPNGDLIIAGAQDKTLRLWSARNGNLVTIMKGHDGPVHAVAFHTQNEWVVSGGKDKHLRAWRESGLPSHLVPASLHLHPYRHHNNFTILWILARFLWNVLLLPSSLSFPPLPPSLCCRWGTP